MDDLRKAAEMALEALEDSMYPQKKQFDAIVGLKQALAQEEQEPVAWAETNDMVCALLKQAHDVLACASYPFKRPWVGLTDEEIAEGVKQSWVTKQAFESAVWWAEIKLKEKNT
jgi:predicted S18 family serine protease